MIRAIYRDKDQIAKLHTLSAIPRLDGKLSRLIADLDAPLPNGAPQFLTLDLVQEHYKEVEAQNDYHLLG